MSFRTLAAAAALAAALLPSSDARACGGCFHEQQTTQSTVVTGHRMAFAVSPTHTVLWDQIKYSGSPGSFAWVLPVKAGAYVELSNDAWFETLDAATTAQMVSPQLNCSFGGGTSGGGGCGIGCGAAAESASFAGPTDDHATPPPVTVTHEGTVGPYETVTLHANVPNALPDWLTSHGFAIDSSVQPIIDAYTSEGFDFIALRLLPDQGVQQMKPVRVVTPGMSPTLPLRMVAAGTGADVAITLFVIGEGRWEAQNFPNAQVDPGKVTWDFSLSTSDYSTQRQAVMAQGGGRTFNNAFAHQGSLLTQDVVNGQPAFITVGNSTFPTLASAYVQQGLSDGEGTDTSCLPGFGEIATSSAKVSGDCLASKPSGGDVDAGADDGGADAGAGPCSVAAGEIDAAQLACGGLDDIAVALVGLHPKDVWLTRLEADLPRTALATDLNLQASAQQTEISNIFNLTQSKNSPCPTTAGAVSSGPGPRSGFRTRVALLGAILAATFAALARRRRGRSSRPSTPPISGGTSNPPAGMVPGLAAVRVR